MRRQSLVGFVILNIVVTFVVALGIIVGYNKLVPPPTPPRIPPLQVIITATTDPNQTDQVRVVVVTATPGNRTLVPLNLTPDATNLALATLGIVPTLDPALLPPVLPTQPGDAAAQGGNLTPTAEGGCQTYTVKAGDTPGGIATTYGVTLAQLYKANNLKIDPILQIGQVLKIPLNGCGLSTDTPTPTPTSEDTSTPLPSATLAPTADKVSIQIAQVIKPGDINEEGVELLNASTAVVDIQDWTIKNNAGETFTFPTYRLFPQARILINTRAGTNTPRVLFWGKSSAVWGAAGETVTLTDNKGVVQGTFTVSGGT